jgi:hypothetical protein
LSCAPAAFHLVWDAAIFSAADDKKTAGFSWIDFSIKGVYSKYK